MSFLKSKINLFGIAVVAVSFSLLPAAASANPPVEGEMEIAPTVDTKSFGFSGADLNNDSVLDVSEFTLYAGDQAVAGDSDYTAIVSSGDYETAFELLDADGDGSLSEAELTGESNGFEDDKTSDDEIESDSDY